MSGPGSGLLSVFRYGQAVSSPALPPPSSCLQLLLWIILSGLVIGFAAAPTSAMYRADPSMGPLATDTAAWVVKLRSAKETAKETAKESANKSSEEPAKATGKPDYINPNSIKDTQFIEVPRLGIPRKAYKEYLKTQGGGCGCCGAVGSNICGILMWLGIMGLFYLIGYVIPQAIRVGIPERFEAFRTHPMYKESYKRFIKPTMETLKAGKDFALGLAWYYGEKAYNGVFNPGKTTEEPEAPPKPGDRPYYVTRNYTGPTRFIHAKLRFLEDQWVWVLLVFVLSTILACAFVWRYMQITKKAIRRDNKNKNKSSSSRTKKKKRGRRHGRR